MHTIIAADLLLGAASAADDGAVGPVRATAVVTFETAFGRYMQVSADELARVTAAVPVQMGGPRAVHSHDGRSWKRGWAVYAACCAAGAMALAGYAYALQQQRIRAR